MNMEIDRNYDRVDGGREIEKGLLFFPEKNLITWMHLNSALEVMGSNLNHSKCNFLQTDANFTETVFTLGLPHTTAFFMSLGVASRCVGMQFIFFDDVSPIYSWSSFEIPTGYVT